MDITEWMSEQEQDLLAHIEDWLTTGEQEMRKWYVHADFGQGLFICFSGGLMAASYDEALAEAKARLEEMPDRPVGDPSWFISDKKAYTKYC